MKQYQIDWLAKFAPLALANEQRYKVPALFTLAQQLVESAWSLKKLGNNFFGIKAGGAWSGASNNQKTHEYDGKGAKYNTSASFRAYPTERDAYEGHAKFLLANKRYKPAFGHTDPYAFAKAVADAHYATDPYYFDKLRTNIAFLSGKPLPAGTGAGIGAGALLLLAIGGYYLYSHKGDE